MVIIRDGRSLRSLFVPEGINLQLAMGKEQDLLDASRGGQFAIVDKILNSRIKKSGPLTLTRYEFVYCVTKVNILSIY